MTKRKLFLLDGHSLVYKAYHAITALTTSKGEPTGAIFGFLQIFHRLHRDHQLEHIAVVFDPPGKTFRADVFPEYKANRPPQPPELTQQFTVLRELLQIMNVPMYEISPYEADDVIATLANWAVQNGGEACVVSVDKDLLQIVQPGVTVLREHLKNIELLDEEGVLQKMGVRPSQIPDYLGLLGDSSDNIPGVPGVGKKRATDLLTEFGDMETILAAAEGRTKPKFWASLAENAEAARKSRELATVKSDIDLDASWDAMVWTYKGSPALREMLSRLEFRSLLDELGGQSIEDRTTDYAVIRTPDQLRHVAEGIRKAGRASVDTETTGLDPFTDDLVGISLSWADNQGVYIPVSLSESDGLLSNKAIWEALNPVLSEPAIRWVAHNWRFDYKVLRKAGYDVDQIDCDTMLASYLIHPERASNGLKNLSMEILGIQMTAISTLIGSGDDMVTMASADVDAVGEYACQDSDVTLKLWRTFSPQIDEAGLREVHDQIEVPLAAVLARMELEGIRLDRPHFKRLSAETEKKLIELTTEIHEMAGRPFNINSTKQLAEILFEDLGLPTQKKTTTGYSTDVTVLEALSKLHPMPAKLLEYRQLEKLKGTYLDPLPRLVHPKTGRVHTSFHQTVAATGRLSSSDPNLQNIPVRTEAGREIRAGFIPREDGWVLLSADYSQIELRILAHMSRDASLCEAFRSGQDIHALTASKVFKVDLDAVTKEMRTQAKAINFGIIYGMSAFRLARDLEIPRHTAEQFIDNYFEVYAGVREFIDTTLEDCRKNGFVTTLKGRRRYVGDINASNGNRRQQAERIAVNSPIQGTSADMIKLAMIRIDREIRQRGLEARMILQVHDELIFDVPQDELEALKPIVVQEMQAALPLDVPIQVDVSSGPNWADV
ncbi:DNA polymerase I [bacterium]|nr:DNA polymerase I [bacterium]